MSTGDDLVADSNPAACAPSTSPAQLGGLGSQKQPTVHTRGRRFHVVTNMHTQATRGHPSPELVKPVYNPQSQSGLGNWTQIVGRRESGFGLGAGDARGRKGGGGEFAIDMLKSVNLLIESGVCT